MIVNKKIIAAASIPVIVLIVMAYNDPRFREHCRYCECENNQSGTLQSSSMFRPRGALARAVYSKQVVDSQLARMDHSKTLKAFKILSWIHVEDPVSVSLVKEIV